MTDEEFGRAWAKNYGGAKPFRCDFSWQWVGLPVWLRNTMETVASSRPESDAWEVLGRTIRGVAAVLAAIPYEGRPWADKAWPRRESYEGAYRG